MWEEIRTWIMGHEEFVVPKLAIKKPSNEQFWEWKN
jgi:hypothetical protein